MAQLMKKAIKNNGSGDEEKPKAKKAAPIKKKIVKKKVAPIKKKVVKKKAPVKKKAAPKPKLDEET